MKKTKIICSIGPSSAKYETFKQMVLNGMNVARINFSHATEEEKTTALNLVKKANEDLGSYIAVLFDTKGPDFRTGKMTNDQINLVEGKTIKIVKDDILGTEEAITVNYKDALDGIEVGNNILLEDGLMKLEVIQKLSNGLNCKIIDGGVLGSRKSVNVPGVHLNMPFISDQDREDIIYACEHDGDYLALSFVSSKEDVLAAREILKEHGREDMQIISKIESHRAIKNLDEIIEASDGVMVARGDLGVEVPMNKLPVLQKEIIEKCRKIGRTVIVATEMLASMYTSSRPTRAEVSADAVKYMADTCEEAEKYYDYTNQKSYARENSIPSAIAYNVVESANLLDVKMIIAATTSGYSAKKISTLKPKSLITAACPDTKVARGLALNYGVYPVIVGYYNTIDELLDYCKKEASKAMNLNKGDIVIVTGGFPRMHEVKTTNFLKIDTI